MKEMLEAAKAAKGEVAGLSTEQKNAALNAMADALIVWQDAILGANALDMESAKAHISPVMLDRLKLTKERIAGMAQGIREVTALPDPVGRILQTHAREDGLEIQKVSVPMGVIAIIYESRPNVTSDAAALALKSGNACVLRSGKEAFRSANAIVDALRSGLRSVGITENAVNLVQDTSRESAAALMTANGYIDLLIPRGGAGLINACVSTATVPCIATGTGICHVYVEKSADLNMALNIVENAKTSRPSVCNAEEVLLVDKAIAPTFLPMLYKRLVTDRERAVELRLDETAAAIIPGKKAGEKDFDTGLHSRRQMRGGCEGGGCPHRGALHRPQRGHRDPQSGGGAVFYRQCGQRGGVCQRLHPVHRRRRIRLRVRDGHFHPEAPRPGTHGIAGADHL